MERRDQDLLLRALDDAPSGEVRRRAQRLLADDAEARAEWRRLHALRAAVAATAEDAFEPGFADAVLQRVAAKERARYRHGPDREARHPVRRRVLGWGVAAVVVGALALFLWMRPHVVHVPYAETTSVTLPDGSTVELASGSTLHYRRPWGWRTRRVHLEGEAFFRVEPGAAPFVVLTFNARVVVHGTRFNVRAWPEDARSTAVTLASGRVAVAPAAAPADTVVLAPGQTTLVTDAPRPRAPSPAVLDHALAWRGGGLAFTDLPLRTVFRSLERRFDVEIAVSPEDIAGQRITLYDRRPASAEAVLATICHTHGLRYRKTAAGFEVVGREHAP